MSRIAKVASGPCRGCGVDTTGNCLGFICNECFNAEEAYKLVKENKLILRSELVGKEVKVEVTL